MNQEHKTGGRRRSSCHLVLCLPPIKEEEHNLQDAGDDENEVKTRRVRSAPPTIMTTHPHDQEELHTCQSDTNCSRNPTKPQKLTNAHFNITRNHRKIESTHNIHILLRANKKQCLLILSQQPAQIPKSEMGLLRFLFYVAINEFPC